MKWGIFFAPTYKGDVMKDCRDCIYGLKKSGDDLYCDRTTETKAVDERKGNWFLAVFWGECGKAGRYFIKRNPPPRE